MKKNEKNETTEGSTNRNFIISNQPISNSYMVTKESNNLSQRQITDEDESEKPSERIANLQHVPNMKRSVLSKKDTPGKTNEDRSPRANHENR